MESPQTHSLLGAAPVRVSAEETPAGVHAGDGVPLHVDKQHSCHCIHGPDSAGSAAQSQQGDEGEPRA